MTSRCGRWRSGVGAGGGGGGAVAVRVLEVCEHGFCAQVAQQACDLAAMISAMICELLKRLPDRIFVHAKITSFIFHHPTKIGQSQVPNKCSQPFRLRSPVIAKRRNGLNVRNIGKSSRRASLASLEPHPFTAANMDQRVAHRGKAGAKWFGE